MGGVKQSGRFRQVWSDQRHLRQQSLTQGLHRRGRQQRIAAFRQHDGIQHHIGHPVARQPLGHGFHNIGLRQHADFGGIDAHIAEYRIELRRHKVRFNTIDRLHAAGILRHQGGDRRAAIGSQRGEGFQIGLDTGPAAGIGAGDGQGVDAFHPCTS